MFSFFQKSPAVLLAVPSARTQGPRPAAETTVTWFGWSFHSWPLLSSRNEHRLSACLHHSVPTRLPLTYLEMSPVVKAVLRSCVSHGALPGNVPSLA